MNISFENQLVKPSLVTSGPFNLHDETGYQSWRAGKLAEFPAALDKCITRIKNLAVPSESERLAIAACCRRANMALYECAAPFDDEAALRGALISFAKAFGLSTPERHRSAGDDGVVALQVSDAPAQRGFIPYTDRPLNWHTDGYYNDPRQPIRSFILHCVRPACSGGENMLLDPEIAYIWLRDENPAFIAALAHPQAMTVPEHIEEDGRVRPASTGPVFSIDPVSGALQMRYTARARNIVWRDDSPTRAAVDFLNDALAAGDPLIFRHRLEPGQGLICNNVLHNRSRFANAEGGEAGRLILRLRYRERIAGTAH